MQLFSKGVIAKRTTTDLYLIVKEVWNDLKETINPSIELRNELMPNMFFVQANDRELYQVFSNLGTNALYAIEEKHTQSKDYIRISAKQHPATENESVGLISGEYSHISVQDTGIGMTNQVKRRAFEPFYSTHKKGPKQGQGLGLAIVYNIITQIYQGAVQIESEYQQGTNFHLYIPRATSRSVTQQSPLDTLVKGTETILIVDDVVNITEILEEFLKRFGYKTMTSNTGSQALEIYYREHQSIDLVILDLIMPAMSGEMVLHSLLEFNPEVKILICSGHTYHESNEFIRQKASGFITKPFTPEALSRSIREALGKL